MLRFRWHSEFEETDVGEIPQDWEISRLSDESKFMIILGQSPPSRYYNQDGKGIPFIQGKTEFGNLHVETNTYTTKCSKIAPPNSVLITVRAPVGELNITKSQLCIGRGVAAVSSKSQDRMQNRFIYYVLTGLKEYLSLLGERGTTYDSITREEIVDLGLPYPSPSERYRIAAVLSWFDDLIENKRRQNVILEEIAMAIFKSWFVDFAPFKDGRFEDSEFGKIPAGWQVKKIQEILDFVKGKTCDLSDEYRDGYTPYLLVETYRTGVKRNWTEKKEPFVDELDIVLIADGENSGKVFRFQKGILGSTLLALKPKDNTHDIRHFVYLMLRNIETELKEFTTGTYLQHLDKNYLADFEFLVPPGPVIEDFNSFVEILFQKIILNQQQITILSETKDTLLPLLIFGKLRVEEI